MTSPDETQNQFDPDKATAVTKITEVIENMDKAIAAIPELPSFFELEARDLNRVGRPPLCVDCYYIVTSPLRQVEGHRCLHPNNYKGINLVDGHRVYKLEYCMNQRGHHIDSCGINGTWFKQKPILPPIIISTNVTNLPKAKGFKVASKDLDNL